jgi:hypothetical protein
LNGNGKILEMDKSGKISHPMMLCHKTCFGPMKGKRFGEVRKISATK